MWLRTIVAGGEIVAAIVSIVSTTESLRHLWKKPGTWHRQTIQKYGSIECLCHLQFKI